MDVDVDPHASSSKSRGSRRSDSTAHIESGEHLSEQQPESESRSGSLEQRRARKREQDRLCQRRKREKDRENLRRLEARLDGLQNADETKTVLDLILRHEQDQAKIDRQVERLRQLQSLLQAGLCDLAKDASSSTPASQTEDWSSTQDVVDKAGDTRFSAPRLVAASNASALEASPATVQPPVSMFDTTTTTTTPAMMYDTPVPVFNGFSGVNTFGPPTSTAINASLAYSRTNPTSGPVPSNAPWLIAGNLLEDACARVPKVGNSVATAEIIDQHIILMVCLHGWDHASAVIRLDYPLWACLRQVDEAVLSTWKSVDRLTGLYCMWRTMKATAQGPKAVAEMTPKFFRPRPSQLHIAHRLDIDYFPWPGVRERLVFGQDRYYGEEKFLRLFSSSTTFLWPFSMADTFFDNKETGLYQFSPELTMRFHDINYWSIDTAFMTEYPEFVDDIPTYNSIPPHVEDKTAGGGQHYYFQNEPGGGRPVVVSGHSDWMFGGA